MPKMKTHKGASKRFKFSGTGLGIKNKAGRRHILECKTSKRKRNMRKAAPLGQRRSEDDTSYDALRLIILN